MPPSGLLRDTKRNDRSFGNAVSEDEEETAEQKDELGEFAAEGDDVGGHRRPGEGEVPADHCAQSPGDDKRGDPGNGEAEDHPQGGERGEDPHFPPVGGGKGQEGGSVGPGERGEEHLGRASPGQDGDAPQRGVSAQEQCEGKEFGTEDCQSRDASSPPAAT